MKRLLITNLTVLGLLSAATHAQIVQKQDSSKSGLVKANSGSRVGVERRGESPRRDERLEELIEESQHLTRLIQRYGRELQGRDRDALARLIKESEDLITGQCESGQEIVYEGECQLDDDAQFDANQVIAGTLRARSVKDLLDQCQSLAVASYGSNGSSGLAKFKIAGEIPEELQVAECHVDDDADFTANQTVVGLLAAESVEELSAECNLFAKAMYKGNGSSGIMNINAGRKLPSRKVIADCWIDDDADYTPDQIFGGKIYANDVEGLISQCKFLAKEKYGSNGSSGIKIVSNSK